MDLVLPLAMTSVVRPDVLHSGPDTELQAQSLGGVPRGVQWHRLAHSRNAKQLIRA